MHIEYYLSAPNASMSRAHLPCVNKTIAILRTVRVEAWLMTGSAECECQMEMDSLKERETEEREQFIAWDASCSTQSCIYNSCFVSQPHICLSGASDFPHLQMQYFTQPQPPPLTPRGAAGLQNNNSKNVEPENTMLHFVLQPERSLSSRLSVSWATICYQGMIDKSVNTALFYNNFSYKSPVYH